MKSLRLISSLLIIASFVLTSCKKVEGEGGSSSIVGKIVANKTNSAGTIIAIYDAQNHDVYIIYGEGGTVLLRIN